MPFPPFEKGDEGGFAIVAHSRIPKIPLDPPFGTLRAGSFPKGEVGHRNYLSNEFREFQQPAKPVRLEAVIERDSVAPNREALFFQTRHVRHEGFGDGHNGMSLAIVVANNAVRPAGVGRVLERGVDG